MIKWLVHERNIGIVAMLVARYNPNKLKIIMWMNHVSKHSKIIRRYIQTVSMGFGFDPVYNDFKVVRIVSHRKSIICICRPLQQIVLLKLYKLMMVLACINAKDVYIIQILVWSVFFSWFQAFPLREQLQQQFCDKINPEPHHCLFKSTSVKNVVPDPDVPRGCDVDSSEYDFFFTRHDCVLNIFDSIPTKIYNYMLQINLTCLIVTNFYIIWITIQVWSAAWTPA